MAFSFCCVAVWRLFPVSLPTLAELSVPNVTCVRGCTDVQHRVQHRTSSSRPLLLLLSCQLHAEPSFKPTEVCPLSPRSVIVTFFITQAGQRKFYMPGWRVECAAAAASAGLPLPLRIARQLGPDYVQVRNLRHILYVTTCHDTTQYTNAQNSGTNQP
jgi:hypothetical protein